VVLHPHIQFPIVIINSIICIFLNHILVGQTGTITGYTKFMFYNAKTGKVATFLNQENASSNNANRIFFEIELNIVIELGDI